jgi:hypothetical protein
MSKYHTLVLPLSEPGHYHALDPDDGESEEPEYFMLVPITPELLSAVHLRLLNFYSPINEHNSVEAYALLGYERLASLRVVHFDVLQAMCTAQSEHADAGEVFLGRGTILLPPDCLDLGGNSEDPKLEPPITDVRYELRASSKTDFLLQATRTVKERCVNTLMFWHIDFLAKDDDGDGLDGDACRVTDAVHVTNFAEWSGNRLVPTTSSCYNHHDHMASGVWGTTLCLVCGHVVCEDHAYDDHVCLECAGDLPDVQRCHDCDAVAPHTCSCGVHLCDDHVKYLDGYKPLCHTCFSIEKDD